MTSYKTGSLGKVLPTGISNLPEAKEYTNKVFRTFKGYAETAGKKLGDLGKFVYDPHVEGRGIKELLKENVAGMGIPTSKEGFRAAFSKDAVKNYFLGRDKYDLIRIPFRVAAIALPALEIGSYATLSPQVKLDTEIDRNVWPGPGWSMIPPSSSTSPPEIIKPSIPGELSKTVKYPLSWYDNALYTNPALMIGGKAALLEIAGNAASEGARKLGNWIKNRKNT